MSRESGIPFGSYRLLRRLARGGMAEVFLARQRGPEGFDRQVAVKRILPHLAETADFVKMFLNEARLAARLTHPNIVHIYELGQVQEYFFIAMEYVDGVTALEMIQASAQDPMPFEIVARIGADAAAGLHHAHEMTDADGTPLGIVHRDISPQNLILSYDGVTKVVDFGIAKAAHQVERTRPGVVKGKYAYMSPEQVIGKRLDGRSDVFSLGIVLWELLAGEYIVPRDDPTEAMRLIRDGRLRSILEARRDTPPLLARAIDSALGRRRDERPSAAQLGLLFEEYLRTTQKVTTNLAVAEWVRRKFPRSPTGSHDAIPDGTAAATVGTVAATAFGTQAPTTPMEVAAAASPAAGGAKEKAAAAVVHRRPRSEDDARTATIKALSAAPEQPVRRRPRLWAAVALAVALAGALALVVWRDRPEEAVAVAPAPEVEPLVAPLDSRGAGAAEGSPGPAVEPTGGAEAEGPADASPAAETAWVEIISDPPGATVRLDGEELETVTPARLEELEPGTYRVEIGLEGYRSVERWLAVAAGERRTLEVSLAALPETPPARKDPAQARRRGRARPSTGYLTARTVPWTDVYLKGQKLGTTPFASIELPAGKHRLVFRNPDAGTVTRTVTIRPGATTKVSFTLSR